MRTVLIYGCEGRGPSLPPASFTASESARSAYGDDRVTAQRRAIARAVEHMPGAFTVENLAQAVRVGSGYADTPSAGTDCGSPAGTATVYRAVASMESSGFVTRVGSRDGHALYAHCTLPSHHHHVVCDGCGRVASAPCPLDSLDLSAPHDSGFVITRHEVTMYGLCHDCNDQKEHA